MLQAYRDRKQAERDRQIEDLKFLAMAMGAQFGSEMPKTGRHAADVIRAMGGKVSTINRSRIPVQ